MRRLKPILLFLTGLLVIVGGFIYDVIFAGIPYQDPTPDMEAKYAYHARIASIFYKSGMLVGVFGAVLALVRKIRP
jgi:hypothetical protein